MQRHGMIKMKEGFLMKLIRAKDYADVSVKAAAVIASVVTLKPDCVLGLATGLSLFFTLDKLFSAIIIQIIQNPSG